MPTQRLSTERWREKLLRTVPAYTQRVADLPVVAGQGMPGRTDVLQGSAPCQRCHWAMLLCGWWSASTPHNAEHLKDISCTGASRDGGHGQQGKLFSSLSADTQILHFQALPEPSWAWKYCSEAPNRHCLNLACALPRCAPATLHLTCVDHLRRFWKRPEVLQLSRN